MSKNSGNMQNTISSKIIGIQFSLLSPEEIRKGSVAEITSRDTYINNKPVINGLFVLLKAVKKFLNPERLTYPLPVEELELYKKW